MSPSSDYNLSFFVKNEIKYRNEIDYIIVINGESYNKDIVFPQLSNLKILHRPNTGFDFGGHNYALKYLESMSKFYYSIKD